MVEALMSDDFSPDLPELKIMAMLAGVQPVAMAAAFNEPERMFERITLDELNRLREAFVRCALLGERLAAACEIYREYAKQILEPQEVSKQ
jgi:hypothetical protein